MPQHCGPILGFPSGSDGRESACNAGDPGSIPGLGRFPEGGNGSPLQCSCLKNPMDRKAWWATVHGVGKSRTLSSHRGFHQAPPEGHSTLHPSCSGLTGPWGLSLKFLLNLQQPFFFSDCFILYVSKMCQLMIQPLLHVTFGGVPPHPGM